MRFLTTTIDARRQRSQKIQLCRFRDFCLLSVGGVREELKKRSPAALAADANAHRVAGRTHAIEPTVFEVDACAAVRMRRELYFDFAGLRQIGLVRPAGGDLPRDHEPARRLPRDHRAPGALSAV